MKELLIGRRVSLGGCNGIIVAYTETPQGRHISVRWEDGNCAGMTKPYAFPAVFLRHGMQVTDGSAELAEMLDAERAYVAAHTCSECGSHAERLYKISERTYCPSCRHKLRKCASCGIYTDFERMCWSPDGAYRCPSCFDTRYPPVTRDLTEPSDFPTISIQARLPRACTNEHKLFCVTAQVMTSKGTVSGRNSIRLYYCETCDRYFLTTASWDHYVRQFGHICLPHVCSEERGRSEIRAPGDVEPAAHLPRLSADMLTDTEEYELV